MKTADEVVFVLSFVCTQYAIFILGFDLDRQLKLLACQVALKTQPVVEYFHRATRCLVTIGRSLVRPSPAGHGGVGRVGICTAAVLSLLLGIHLLKRH